jgi:hypothetical protein
MRKREGTVDTHELGHGMRQMGSGTDRAQETHVKQRLECFNGLGRQRARETGRYKGRPILVRLEHACNSYCVICGTNGSCNALGKDPCVPGLGPYPKIRFEHDTNHKICQVSGKIVSLELFSGLHRSGLCMSRSRGTPV